MKLYSPIKKEVITKIAIPLSYNNPAVVIISKIVKPLMQSQVRINLGCFYKTGNYQP